MPSLAVQRKVAVVVPGKIRKEVPVGKRLVLKEDRAMMEVAVDQDAG